MPEIGEITRARDVGLNSGYHKVIWLACSDCGKERWVLFRKGVPQNDRCQPCAMRYWGPRQKHPARCEHPRWKGGRHQTVGGYVRIVVDVDDPLIVMADRRGRVFEHRLLMARHLGRPLLSSEQVHHRNSVRDDNRIENLELLSRSEHSAEPFRELARLRARVRELEDELAALKAETP